MRKRSRLQVLIMGLLVWACQSFYISDSEKTQTRFSSTKDLGILANIEIDEASGMVASHRNPGHYWVINDSKDLNRMFLVNDRGQGKAEFSLLGLHNRDWEAMGRWQNRTGQTYLYVADIGDNFAQNPTYQVHRFLEPSLHLTDPLRRVIKHTQSLEFILPDGSRDMECMLIDQVSGDLYFISKREDRKRLYQLPAEAFSAKGIQKAKFMQELTFSIPSSEVNLLKQLYFITDGNVASSNEEIIVRNYLEIYYWKKQKHESIEDALLRNPRIVPSILEPQGEALAFDGMNKGYATISEIASLSSPAHLYYTAKR
ncbi:MAG: hypothetical protein AABZ56_00010 [Bacteroidota bacterium]